MESFEGSGILVTEAKVSLHRTGLAIQLLKVKDQYECLLKLIETLESTTQAHTSKKRRKQSKNLTSEKKLAALTIAFENDISEIMNMERSDISPAAYGFLQHS